MSDSILFSSDPGAVIAEENGPGMDLSGLIRCCPTQQLQAWNKCQKSSDFLKQKEQETGKREERRVSYGRHPG